MTLSIRTISITKLSTTIKTRYSARVFIAKCHCSKCHYAGCSCTECYCHYLPGQRPMIVFLLLDKEKEEIFLRTSYDQTYERGFVTLKN